MMYFFFLTERWSIGTTDIPSIESIQKGVHENELDGGSE